LTIPLSDFKRGGEVHPVATLVRLDEARRFFGVTTDEALQECVTVADELGLLIRSTPGRRTIQYAARGESQARFYGMKGYGPSVAVAVRNERVRRNAERVETKLPPAGKATKGEGGRLVMIRGLNF
jgi:hypothetical protein